jgi:hypothetical protein
LLAHITPPARRGEVNVGMGVGQGAAMGPLARPRALLYRRRAGHCFTGERG